MWICLYNARSRGRDQSMCQTRVTADTLDSEKKPLGFVLVKKPTYTILCHNLFFSHENNWIFLLPQWDLR